MGSDVVLARRAIAMIDLTNLSAECNGVAIDQLCDRATGPHGNAAAVCVWPRFVTQAHGCLVGTGVHIATVVNFPDGGVDVASTVTQTRAAIVDGADEIDLVLPYRSFLAGQIDIAAGMIDAVRSAAQSGVLVKVILESGEYPGLSEVRRAAVLAIDHGADFVKTSTGKTSTSATLAATVMILDAIRDADRPVGCKPSGGIKTTADALRYLALAEEMMGREWATATTFRFGASGLLDDLEATVAAADQMQADQI